MRKVKLPISIAGLVFAGVLLCSGPAQALPSIGNVYPNGTNMFQPSASLTFTANSGTGVTNIVVDLTATNLYTGAIILSHLTSTSGLTVGGSNVSAPLSSNSLYAATITVSDASGSVSVSESFDTISPAYTWEGEDFDYGGGLSFDTGVNQYAGQTGVAGTDYNNGNPGNGNADYRPKGLETENPNSGDSPLRREYIGTTNRDYNVGWTAGGDWGNYTHQYPAGTYIIFVRASGGNGPRTESGDISIVSGTAMSTNAGPFKYGIKGRGWGAYDFMPVTDNGGNLVQITFDGSACTLRETQNQGSDNFNFFMLMPVPTIAASTVSIINVTPDGSVQFQGSNNLSFTVSSTVPVTLNSVQVQLSATTLFGSNSTALLSIGGGLSYTGNSTNIVVTTPLSSNTVYSALILANDANGVQTTFSVGFDTITPSYIFEGEDFNYGGGNYFGATGPNTPGDPPPDAYAGSAHDGALDIDFHKIGNTLGAYGRAGLNAENASDINRASYNIGGGVYTNDYDIGNTSGGDWGNYTRTFPVGTFNIFVRVARGNGGSVTDAGKISLVTSDPTQSGQTIQDIGKHNTPSTGGWQNYVWMPILNNAGFPAQFVGDGTLKTLRYTFDGAGDNLGFVMLLPAVAGNPPPFVSTFTPDSSQLFQPSNTLTFVVNSSAGIPQGNVALNLNGANVSGLSFSGSSHLWNVSYPIKTNSYYTAIITLTDTAGTTVTTNVFTTFDPNSYQWEAEDYNFNGGQFVENPQVNSYNGAGSVANVDNVQTDLNNNAPHDYRADLSPGKAPGTSSGDLSGELPRANFTSGGGGGTDYDVGYFGYGGWLNYTRTFPGGTYYVFGRFAEGNNATEDTLSWVNGDASTTNQTATLLGTFPIQAQGWSSWHWSPMVDGSGNLVKITLDGQLHTLRLGGTPVVGHDEANAGFFVLVATTPAPPITTSIGGGNVTLSFYTQSGYSYQVQYKDDLSDMTWTPLGGPLSGNDAVQSASYSTAGNGHRFYRVSIQ